MSIEGKHFYRFTYLKSEEWKTARMIALVRQGAKCALCGKVDWSNDAHHRKYPDDIWNTTHHHLVILCRQCHEEVHRMFGNLASKGKWKSRRKAIETARKIEYLKTHPEPLICTFCQRLDSVRKIKTLKTRVLGICPLCEPTFRKHEDSGLTFWKSVNATKEEIKLFRCSILLAARRLFSKLDKKSKPV